MTSSALHTGSAGQLARLQTSSLIQPLTASGSGKGPGLRASWGLWKSWSTRQSPDLPLTGSGGACSQPLEVRVLV